MEHDPYQGMTDVDVLTRAREACKKAAALPSRSIQRSIQWAVFDGAMMELDGRLVRHVLAKLGRSGDEDA